MALTEIHDGTWLKFVLLRRTNVHSIVYFMIVNRWGEGGSSVPLPRLLIVVSVTIV